MLESTVLSSGIHVSSKHHKYLSPRSSWENSDFITVSDLCENNHKYMHLGDNHKYVKCTAYFEVCSSVSGKKIKSYI